jgi:hypothetical protein
VRGASAAVVAAAALVAVPAAGGAWLEAGAGSGAAAAKTMPAGNQPSAGLALTSVTVSWSASSFDGGPNVSGYVVKRYDLLGNPQTVGAACGGVVSGTSCTENSVPVGTWQYTVTPAQGTWRGAQSVPSLPVVVP